MNTPRKRVAPWRLAGSNHRAAETGAEGHGDGFPHMGSNQHNLSPNQHRGAEAGRPDAQEAG